MLYQTLLTGQHPYLISVSHMSGFPEHRHLELELSYCISGSYSICIDRQICIMHEGDLALIGSMVPHMIPTDDNRDCIAMTIEVGPALLTEHFKLFAETGFRDPVIRLSRDEKLHSELRDLLSEIYFLNRSSSDVSELIIKGDLYKLCAYILSHFTSEKRTKHSSKEMQNIAHIEQALELIRSRYAEPLTVEQVAAMSGYSKSNFCKIFKQVTGDTFHVMLNRCRVENACILLKNTTESVENIAQRVGFLDAKAFCRVFKNTKGISPGGYRKEHI